ERSRRAGSEEFPAAERPAVPPACRTAPPARRSPPSTHRKAIPLSHRTIRTSHSEEEEARAQGPDGNHRPGVHAPAQPRLLKAASAESWAGLTTSAKAMVVRRSLWQR